MCVSANISVHANNLKNSLQFELCYSFYPLLEHYRHMLKPKYQPATKRPQLSHFENLAVQDKPEQPKFVVVWDNFSFHRDALVQNWFTNYDQF